MTAEQLVVGNKYVPFQKTTGIEFSQSDFIQQSLPYLYYKKCVSGLERHTFSKNMEMLGDYYNPEDVYEYIESVNGINRGDLVVIKDSGETYCTYGEAFKKLQFKDKEYNNSWENGTQGKAFGLMYNSEKHIMIAVRDNAGIECLIGVNGVELAVQSTTDFVLPEKWAIEINPDNVDMLVDWRGYRIVNDDDGYYMLCDIPEGHHASVERGYVSRTLFSGYTLITTEQFKQYVLNQKPTETSTEFVLPEHWHIKVTAENNKMLGNWRSSGDIDGLNGVILSEHYGHRGYWIADCMDIPNPFRTEITTEQFKQYVLNQTNTDMPTQEQTPQTETKQYPKTPEGLYDMTLDMLNIEKGDIVKVTHKTPSHYMGWSNSWCPDMDAMIGNEYEVSRISDTRHGISLHDHPFNFPPYSLEFVRKGGVEESYHINKTIGRLKYGADAFVKFDQPITELAANDVYWLAKLFVKQNRKNELRLAEL